MLTEEKNLFLSMIRCQTNFVVCPSKKKEQRFCRNSAVHFSVEFPHCFCCQKNLYKKYKNATEIVKKNGQQNVSRIFALFFTTVI